jgi:PST family polysaccharide transporter
VDGTDAELVAAGTDPAPGRSAERAGASTGGDPGLRRAAVSGAAWSLAQAWGGRLVSTIAFLMLARLLSADDFGVVALAAIVIDLGQVIILRGFGAILIQREDLTEKDVDSAFWFTFAVGSVLALATWMLAAPLAEAAGEPGLTPVLRALSASWILGAFWSVPQNLLQRELRFRSLAIRRLAAVTISGVLAVALALAGAGVWSLVALTLSQNVVSIIVLWSVSSWRPSFRVSRASLVSMRGFALSIVGIEIVRFLAVRGEGMLIGVLISPIALGYYAVAQRFLQLLNEIFTSTIGSVAFPIFSRLQNDEARRSRALTSIVQLTSLASLPAFTGLAVLAPEIVEVCLGSKWEPSVVLIQLLALHGLRYAITYFVSSVVISTGSAAFELRITLLGVVIKAMCLAVGVQFGVVGVATSVVISSWGTLPLTLYALRRTTGITAGTYLRSMLEPAIAAGAMCAAVVGTKALLADTNDLLVLVCGVVVGVGVYTLVIMLIAPRLLRELVHTVRLLRGDRNGKGVSVGTVGA